MKRLRAHRLIREAHRQFDRLAGARLAKARHLGEVPPCGPSCAWCCSEPVLVEQREAALLATHVRAMAPADRARVEAATRAWQERFLATPLAAAPKPNAFAYRALRLPCPLLHNGLCMVYADRPIGCRAHVARRDALGCADDALRPRQEFLRLEDLVAEAMVPLWLQGTEHDHLGLLLYRELFGGTTRSAANVRTEPRPHGTVEVIAEAEA